MVQRRLVSLDFAGVEQQYNIWCWKILIWRQECPSMVSLNNVSCSEQLWLVQELILNQLSRSMFSSHLARIASVQHSIQETPNAKAKCLGSPWPVMTEWFLAHPLQLLGASSYCEVDLHHSILLTSICISQERLFVKPVWHRCLLGQQGNTWQ